MASYKLRKTTVFKRARELSILCDVDVALIMYHPGCAEPEFWCSKPDCRQVINKYLSMNNLPQVELHNNVKEEVVRDDHEFIQGLGVNDLYGFERFLAGKLEFVNERINVVKGGDVWDLGFDDGSGLTWDDVSPSDYNADNNDLGEVCNNDDGDLFEGLEDIVHIDDIEKFSDEKKEVKVGSSSECVGSDDPGSVIDFESLSDMEDVAHTGNCAEEEEVRVGLESGCVGGGDPDSVIDFGSLLELDGIDFGEEDDAFDWTKELMMMDSNDHQPALPIGITC